MTDRPMFDPKTFATGKVNPAEAERDTLMFDPAAIRLQMQAKQQQAVDLYTAPLGPVPAWSFSRLMKFEDCPYSIKLSAVDRMPDPSGPAAERGTQVHDHIEGYIRTDHDNVIKEMLGFRPLIDTLREQYAEGCVEVEGDWGFRRDWSVTEWRAKDCWARIKLDVMWHESQTSAMVIDWKTGRKFGNELKHQQQGMTYAIGAFRRFPALEYIKVKFAYLDKNEELVSSYTRQQAALLEPMLTERALKLTTATEFEPKPSFHACRWCPHAKVQEGFDAPACAYADEHTLQ